MIQISGANRLAPCVLVSVLRVQSFLIVFSKAKAPSTLRKKKGCIVTLALRLSSLLAVTIVALAGALCQMLSRPPRFRSGAPIRWQCARSGENAAASLHWGSHAGVRRPISQHHHRIS